MKVVLGSTNFLFLENEKKPNPCGSAASVFLPQTGLKVIRFRVGDLPVVF